MSSISDHDKKLLLDLARQTIAEKLKINKNSAFEPLDPTPALNNKQGCFVTLHKKGTLRGCIGTIEPTDSLFNGVKRNAVNAAFNDPRFPDLKPDEYNLIDIEISVLTPPEKLIFDNPDDLIKKLKPGIHGVILSNGWRRSTFLPQVWDQLPDTESFLKHLCTKANLGGDCWRDENTEIEVYTADYFEEKK